jgi:hypothetical protein
VQPHVNLNFPSHCEQSSSFSAGIFGCFLPFKNGKKEAFT